MTQINHWTGVRRMRDGEDIVQPMMLGDLTTVARASFMPPLYMPAPTQLVERQAMGIAWEKWGVLHHRPFLQKRGGGGTSAH
jgi:hypothetical protein